MSTHAPGPWTVGQSTETHHDRPKPYTSWSAPIWDSSDANTGVCIVTGGVNRTIEQARANARLIAAAPELATALRECVALFSQMHIGSRERIAALRADLDRYCALLARIDGKD